MIIPQNLLTKNLQVTFIFRGIFFDLVEVLYLSAVCQPTVLSTVCQPTVLSAVLTAAAVLAAAAVFEAAVFVLAAVVFVLEAVGFGE